MGRNRFVLVDVSPDPQYPQVLTWHAQSAGLTCRSLFERQPEADLVDAGPWLAALPDEPFAQPMIAWITLVERAGPCVAWLESDADFEALFDHLEAQLDIELSDGDLAMCRFWDPRVWQRLQRILTLDQRLELLGPVDTWTVVLRDRAHPTNRQDLEWMREEQERAQEAADADVDV